MKTDYRLPDHFYTMPVMAKTSCTTKELRSLMLNSTGKVFAHGKSWDIKHKRLGGGVVEVFLEETFKEKPLKKEKANNIKNQQLKDALLLMVELYEKDTGKDRTSLPSLITNNLKG